MFDVVINPAAASGRVKKVWLRTIEPIFQAANVDYNVHFSTLEYNIPEIMRDLTSKHEKRVQNKFLKINRKKCLS